MGKAWTPSIWSNPFDQQMRNWKVCGVKGHAHGQAVILTQYKPPSATIPVKEPKSSNLKLLVHTPFFPVPSRSGSLPYRISPAHPGLVLQSALPSPKVPLQPCLDPAPEGSNSSTTITRSLLSAYPQRASPSDLLPRGYHSYHGPPWRKAIYLLIGLIFPRDLQPPWGQGPH